MQKIIVDFSYNMLRNVHAVQKIPNILACIELVVRLYRWLGGVTVRTSDLLSRGRGVRRPVVVIIT